MSVRNIRDLKPRNFTEFVGYVDALQEHSSGTVWYRGCRDRKYSLLPSIYRKRENPSVGPEKLSELEAELVQRFRSRSIPYHNRDLTDGLETLFFMQHYSIPTRLLDWTENPFTALFFALREARYERTTSGGVSYTQSAAVWVLDPTKWNQSALSHQTYTGGPLDSAHPALASYRVIGDIDNIGKPPLALYGAHNSERIVAQQGTFVIFGSENTALENLYRTGSYPDKSLFRITISRGVIGELRESLLSHGFTEAIAFPELEGLGRDIRRTLGFDL